MTLLYALSVYSTSLDPDWRRNGAKTKICRNGILKTLSEHKKPINCPTSIQDIAHNSLSSFIIEAKINP